MSISLFQDSATYRDINSHTHRIRPPDVSGPALTWHTAYWIEDHYKQNFNNEEPVEFVKSELDRIIGSTLRALSVSGLDIPDLKVIPRDEGKIILFRTLINESTFTTERGPSKTKRQTDILNGDNRAITFGFTVKNVHYRFRFELHTEYFTITMIAEPKCLKNIKDNKLAAAFSLLRYLIASKGRLFWPLQNAINFYLYETFWQELIVFLEFDCSIGPMYDNEIFRQIFGDFRGLVLSERHIACLRQPVMENNCMTNWGKDVADSLLGFMTYNKRYEGTASYVLDGRGIYITALGPQLGTNYNRIRSPVTFILCVKQHNKHSGRSVVNNTQLGRLVSTFLILGTVRVAALRDLNKLRASGSLLGKFEPLTRATQQQFRQIATDRAPTLELQSVMDRIYDSFGRIGSDLVPKLQSISEKDKNYESIEKIKAPAGLQYRVERSRYYVSEFERNARYIRAKRIDGYQTYEEFVERRLKSAYDYIDRLGKRFERAVSILSLIEQNYLALRADKTERDLKEIATKVGDIQTYGEVILLAILVPYYLVSTIQHIAHEKEMFARFFQVLIVALLITATTMRYVTWVREGKLVLRWVPLPERERLSRYAYKRKQLWDFIFMSKGAKYINTEKIAAAGTVSDSPILIDIIRIKITNALYALSSRITIQAVVVFLTTIAVWLLVLLPISMPSHPAPKPDSSGNFSTGQGH